MQQQCDPLRVGCGAAPCRRQWARGACRSPRATRQHVCPAPKTHKEKLSHYIPSRLPLSAQNVLGALRRQLLRQWSNSGAQPEAVRRCTTPGAKSGGPGRIWGGGWSRACNCMRSRCVARAVKMRIIDLAVSLHDISSRPELSYLVFCCEKHASD